MAVPQYTSRQRKVLIDKIAQLNETEHLEVFKILQNCCHNVAFTQNRNGIFYNFRLIPSQVCAAIEQFVDFCKVNKEHLDAYDRRMSECKLNNNYTTLVDIHQDQNAPPAHADLPIVLRQHQAMHSYNDEWMMRTASNAQDTKVASMVDTLESSMQRVLRKKTCNLKFANAKKRFSRKVQQDKKAECEVTNILEAEPYLS